MRSTNYGLVGSILTLFFYIPCLASITISSQFHIFKHFVDKPDINNKYIYPLFKGGKYDYIALIAQEENILKIAFYKNDSLTYRCSLLYIYNPSLRNFKGMSARYIVDNTGRSGILFEDGTALYSSLPSDAYPMGTSEWMYEMRWRRVYKNYYLITVFRGSGEALKEELMTERDGKDLTLALGDSSADPNRKEINGSISADICIYYKVQDGNEIIYKDLNLVPVEEKDLPSDFPKGLVCWIP